MSGPLTGFRITKVPAFRRDSMTPSALNRERASRIVERETLNCTASSFSAGNFPDGAKSP